MAPSAFRALTRADLLRQGMTPAGIAKAVRAGSILRGRNGRYLPRDAPADIVRAVRAGGRLACVSALALHGVFVRESRTLHVHLARNASRGGAVLGPVVRQWEEPVNPVGESTVVDVVDALRQAIRCQSPRDAVATLDSALNKGLITVDDLDAVFEGSGSRSSLRRLVDARAEAGTETLVRLILRALGAAVDIQVRIDGVGRVDLVVDGWLVVECDSRAYHSDWAAQVRDRRRDQELAARGFVVYRPIAEDILYRPDLVIAALRGLLRGVAPRRNSGRLRHPARSAALRPFSS